MYQRNLKAREPMTLDQVMQRAPSVFAKAPAAKVSERYEFIPTTQVIELLGREGWTPVSADQTRSKTAEGRDFVKHVVHFQNKSVKQIGDSLPELILTNSHNGMAAFNIMAGLYRLVCSNGLVAFSAAFGSHSIKHVGFKATEVLDASYKIIQDVPMLANSVDEMSSVALSRDEQMAFANSALTLKYDDGKAPIAAEQLLMTRRYEDRQENLWTTFNAVQENLIKGGLKGRTRNANGRSRRASTRAITSVGENLKMNKALWQLAEEMKRLKVG